MKKHRILVLLNDYHLPPEGIAAGEFDRDKVSWTDKHDVMSGLSALGHEVLAVALSEELAPLKDAIESFKPHIVFNMLLEFKGETVFDQNVLAYLELLGVPYTGCNPRGYMLARNKILAKKLFEYHGIKTPRFACFTRHQAITEPDNLSYPLIVKCVTEDASLGMSQSSLVHNFSKLKERIAYLYENFGSDVIVEEFIEGREIYVGILGNKRLQVFPPWELLFDKAKAPEKEFYHTYAKWNDAYRTRKGIHSEAAKLSDKDTHKLNATCKKVYRSLDLSGYARLDFRMDNTGDFHLLEVNPNPDMTATEDFSLSAKAYGLSYLKLLDCIIALGLKS